MGNRGKISPDDRDRGVEWPPSESEGPVTEGEIEHRAIREARGCVRDSIMAQSESIKI